MIGISTTTYQTPHPSVLVQIQTDGSYVIERRACPVVRATAVKQTSTRVSRALLRGARDEEPLVNGRVDGCRCVILASGDVERVRINTVGRVRHRDIGQRDAGPVTLAQDEALPGFGALTHNVHGVLLVFALAGECKLVLGLAIRDLVDAEPFVGGAQQARQVAFNVLDVVKLGRQRVFNVNDNDFPVCLLLVQQSHHTENLDLLDFTGFSDQLADLAHVQWVVVALGLGLRMNNVGVFPSLVTKCERTREEQKCFEYLPAGRLHSSTNSPCAGSSYERSEACPS